MDVTRLATRTWRSTFQLHTTSPGASTCMLRAPSGVLTRVSPTKQEVKWKQDDDVNPTNITARMVPKRLFATGWKHDTRRHVHPSTQ